MSREIDSAAADRAILAMHAARFEHALADFDHHHKRVAEAMVGMANSRASLAVILASLRHDAGLKEPSNVTQLRPGSTPRHNGQD